MCLVEAPNILPPGPWLALNALLGQGAWLWAVLSCITAIRFDPTWRPCCKTQNLPVAALSIVREAGVAILVVDIDLSLAQFQTVMNNEASTDWITHAVLLRVAVSGPGGSKIETSLRPTAFFNMGHQLLPNKASS